MRLLKPTPGEVVDRQTILALKIKAGSASAESNVTDEVEEKPNADIARSIMHDAPKINIQPFVDENEMLQTYLEEHWFPDLSTSKEKQLRFDSLFDMLSAVNARLWRLEDKARILRDAPDRLAAEAAKEAAGVLFSINDMNDNRSELVQEINKVWNMQTQEKIYA